MKIINASHWPVKTTQSAQFFCVAGFQKQIFPEVFSEAINPKTWINRVGAFATVFVDQQSDDIVLVRDHFGIEPLYYYLDKQQFIFSSNLPDILKHLSSKPDLNKEKIFSVFSFERYYSDETFYENIFRVEPGCILHIKSNGNKKKILYWELDKNSEDIAYKTDEDYLEKFAELMNESVRFNTENVPNLAGELSGGLDSSSILVTAHQQKVNYPLFMHIANPGSRFIDDSDLAKSLLKKLNIDTAHYVSADDFDPVKAFQFCSEQFAGAAPYSFFMFAHNIHQAVQKGGYQVLLSGGGGDECVSNHAFLPHFLPDAMKRGKYRTAWKELYDQSQVKKIAMPSFLRRFEQLIKYSNPIFYHLSMQLENTASMAKRFLLQQEKIEYRKPLYYRTLREHEWDCLQGPNSDALRMRIEYSTVIAKAMGFEYRYPLLYPKLVEFCFRLPLDQKRRNGMGRYLMRRYLEKFAPPEIYNKLQKVGGIAPGTLDKCHHYLNDGCFKEIFKNLPYVDWAPQKKPHNILVSQIFAYMFQYYDGLVK